MPEQDSVLVPEPLPQLPGPLQSQGPDQLLPCGLQCHQAVSHSLLIVGGARDLAQTIVLDCFWRVQYML